MRGLALLLLAACASLAGEPAADYDALLGRIVKKDGVDYDALTKERALLDRYVKSLEKAKPGKSDAEQIAFWINAYNALTLQQVIDTRPDEEPGKGEYSVQKVRRFWKGREWLVAGREVDLDEIEHGILREDFREPRIHFAVNCASVSCPPLAPRLWKAATLDVDLKSAAIAYLSDKKQNRFDEARLSAEISMIFRWFRDDFERGYDGKVPELQLFLADYVPRGTLAKALRAAKWRIRFLDYDWRLNTAGVKRGSKRDGPVSPIWFILYLIPTIALLAYGLHSYKLLRWRRRDGERYQALLRSVRADSPLGRTSFPRVLVQVPVFNEPGVVDRVIAAVSAFDYPRDRFAIQVLDDSTDSTVALVDAAVARERARGVPISVLRRSHRDGFKAGALDAGLAGDDAEFVAIFDADFLPPPGFLREGLALFDAGERVGCVQGRWEHTNRGQNWLTRAQAVGVDAHFHVQQFARAAAGKFLNFNGTAGIWRRTAIDDAGGWSGDTLTEDLDLSYRAQLRGWRILYDPELVAPAELPPTIAAFKSQQRRWACGSIQCARKHLGAVWRSGRPFGVKVEATMHLCGYMVCVAMASFVLFLPFGVWHYAAVRGTPHWWPMLAAIWLAALGPIAVSVAGQRARGRVRFRDIYSCFLLGLGVCMNNAVAVLRGLLRPIRTFVRTPKQGTAARPAATPAPRLEQGMALTTFGSLCYLALIEQPLALVVYALFCSAGFWMLAGYWWVAERPRRSEA